MSLSVKTHKNSQDDWSKIILLKQKIRIILYISYCPEIPWKDKTNKGLVSLYYLILSP